MAEPDSTPLSIAIVGGGITGVCLAVGLLQIKPQIHLAVYEQAHNFAEIGAGVAFSPNAVRAMQSLHAPIFEAFERVATRNGDPDWQDVWFDFVDGHAHNDSSEDERHLFLVGGAANGDGVHRAHFLDELIKLVPDGVAHFSKHLSTITQASNHRQILHFADGTTAEHDAVIGCDGIKSRVRSHILPPDHPAIHPQYTHKYAYRGLVPMDQATAALGARVAQNRHFHLGPRGHLLTFPVAKGKLMNVVAFVQDDQDWTSPKLVLPCTKHDAIADFADWHPKIRAIMDLLLDNLDRWAIFDTHDHPLPTYAQGLVCVAGDAAHASSPHHGAGAGFGVEDAAVLKGLVHDAATRVAQPGADRVRILTAAFQAFDHVRRARTQWLVGSSRKVGNMYDYMDQEVGTDPAAIYEELQKRCRIIWDGDVEGFIRDAVEDTARRLAV